MISAMFNGISGLNSFERAIDVEGNNVSNSSTIGHKEDVVTFEDMMYKSGYGKGVGIQTVQKNFFQGELQSTGVNLDVAIEGSGFFTVTDRKTGELFYSRAGNFQQGSDRLLETQEGLKVLGLSPQVKNVIATNAADTMFTNDFNQSVISLDIKNGEDVYNYNAKTTDFYSSATDDTLKGSNYKTASSKINDVELLKNNYIDKLKLLQSNYSSASASSSTQISQLDFSSVLSQLNDQNDFISVNIDGNEYKEYFDTNIETTVNNLSDKISSVKGYTSSMDLNSGVLTIENLVPGSDFNISESYVNSDFVSSINTQEATLGSGALMVDSARDALKKAVENAGGKYLEITSALSYGDKTVIGASDINLSLNALGLVEDDLGTISISDDGLVYVTSGENKFLVSKIQTVDFRNEQGLNAIGDNMYTKTDESGNPFNADNLNKLTSNFLERGNVTFNNSLSKILFYQKAYEANSKSITTSDEFLQTAIQMKK